MHPLALYLFLLEQDGDQARALEQRRLLDEARAGRAERPSRVRRSIALVLASLSRASAGAVRRLDECVADDLGRALAPAE